MAAGERGIEKMAVLSSALFLLPNWSGVLQSPVTHPWSSSPKGWAGEVSVASLREQMKWGLPSEPERAVSNKNLYLQPALPLALLQFHQICIELAMGGEPPYFQSYTFLCVAEFILLIF